MSEFRFAYPLVFGLLVLVLIAWLAGLRNRWQPAPAVIRYSDTRLLYGLPVGWRVKLRRLPDALRLVAWVLLVVALARPQSGRAQDVIRGQGVDIVLALDISGSMSALDFGAQNRLEVAKGVIGDFVAKRDFDRVGLVVFARNAFEQSPPTLDYDTLLQLLQEVRLVTDIPNLEDGTAVGLGLATAANMLRSSDAASKVVILLTDGADNVGKPPPISAAQSVAVLGIKVYTIGMGKPGTAENALDEGTLQSMAQVARGQYFRAADAAGLHQIYDQIDRLERSEMTRQIFVRWQDQAVGWLVVGLTLLVGERLLRLTLFQTIP